MTDINKLLNAEKDRVKEYLKTKIREAFSIYEYVQENKDKADRKPSGLIKKRLKPS
jgi:hypothetical protein